MGGIAFGSYRQSEYMLALDIGLACGLAVGVTWSTPACVRYVRSLAGCVRRILRVGTNDLPITNDERVWVGEYLRPWGHRHGTCNQRGLSTSADG